MLLQIPFNYLTFLPTTVASSWSSVKDVNTEEMWATKMAMQIIPVSIHTIETARAMFDLGVLSPYLRENIMKLNSLEIVQSRRARLSPDPDPFEATGHRGWEKNRYLEWKFGKVKVEKKNFEKLVWKVGSLLLYSRRKLGREF